MIVTDGLFNANCIHSSFAHELTSFLKIETMALLHAEVDGPIFYPFAGLGFYTSADGLDYMLKIQM